MLTIIHGDDLTASRKYFSDLKQGKNFHSFEAENLDTNLLRQSLEGDLFINDKYIFIENLFSKKAQKNFELIKNFLNENSNVAEITVWDNKEIPKKNLASFRDANIKLFKLPQEIFELLDSIIPANKSMVAKFHRALKNNEVEIIFYLIIRQFRLMIGLVEKSEIEEVKRLAPWQKSKLIGQAGLFGTDKLKSAYKKLFEIDRDSKSGRLGTSLSNAIDIFLLRL